MSPTRYGSSRNFRNQIVNLFSATRNVLIKIKAGSSRTHRIHNKFWRMYIMFWILDAQPQFNSNAYSRDRIGKQILKSFASSP